MCCILIHSSKIYDSRYVSRYNYITRMKEFA